MVLPFTTRLQTARVAIKRAGDDWNQIGVQALFYWDSIVAKLGLPLGRTPRGTFRCAASWCVIAAAGA